jgi:hypothetical protein
MPITMADFRRSERLGRWAAGVGDDMVEMES